MQITFLGTSHGVPSCDRYCSCALIEAGNSFYFIDAGAPVADLVHRRGLDVRNFRAVFTTHVHSDHTAGIPALAGLLHWRYRDCAADFFLTEPPLAAAMEALIAASDPEIPPCRERVRFRIAEAGEVYKDENVKVTYIPTHHMGAGHPTYAILVTEGDKTALFTGDLSHGLKHNDLPAVALEGGVDLMVCELAHFGLLELAPYLEGLRVRTLCFHHVSPVDKYGDINAIRDRYPFTVHTPKDGDTLTL